MPVSHTQPASTLDALIAQHAGVPGPLLPILHAIQAEYGFIDPESVGTIATALNISRAEIHGVISFYHYFRQERPGKHIVQVCRAEACQAWQGEETEAHARKNLGVDYHGTSADGVFTLEPAYCLGNCAAGPSVMIGDRLYGRVTPVRLDELLSQWRKQS